MASQRIERTITCRCKKARVTLIGEPLIRTICHCHDCRKANGGQDSQDLMFASIKQIVAPVNLKQVAGSEYNDKVPRYFCKDCGTFMYGDAAQKGGAGCELVPLVGALLAPLGHAVHEVAAPVVALPRASFPPASPPSLRRVPLAAPFLPFSAGCGNFTSVLCHSPRLPSLPRLTRDFCALRPHRSHLGPADQPQARPAHVHPSEDHRAARGRPAAVPKVFDFASRAGHGRKAVKAVSIASLKPLH